MKVLLVVSNPHSSLDVLARATLDAVKEYDIEVCWLYAPMFEEMMIEHPGDLEEFDLIHFLAGVESFSYAAIEKAASHCPVISTFHHREFSEIPAQFQHVDVMCYVSPSLQSEVSRILPPGIETRLLADGVDTSFFVPREKQENSADFVIGFFGTQQPALGDRKGSRCLLEVAERLVAANLHPAFLIVGYGWSSMVARLRKLGLRVSYRVNVSQAELLSCYQRLDLYLITSRVEGGPLTLLEAAACGVPIVSTPVGLAREVLSQPGCGRLLKGFGSEEVAAALMDDMHHRTEAFERARIVRAEVCKRWDWEKTYELLPRLYRDVAHRRPGRRRRMRGILHARTYRFFEFDRDPQQQRRSAREHATAQFAWRLYHRGDRQAGWRVALSVCTKVSPRYWWDNFLKNVVAAMPAAQVARNLVRRYG